MIRCTLLLVALCATARPALAQDSDLLEDMDRAVRRYDAPPGEASAPRFRASDIYDHPVSLSDYRSTNVVLTFLSPRCYKEAVAWVQGVQTSFLGEKDVAFVNVLFPGSMPAFSSRGQNQRKIREKIEDFYVQVRDHMPATEKRRLESTEIRWIVDWRQQLHQRYDVEADKVHIFLIDSGGKVCERIDRRSPESEKRLVDAMTQMRGARRPE